MLETITDFSAPVPRCKDGPYDINFLSYFHHHKSLIRDALNNGTKMFKELHDPDLARKILVQGVADYLSLIQSTAFPFSKSPNVQAILDKYDTTTLSRYIVGGFVHGAGDLLLMGRGWNEAGSTVLPILQLGFQKGVYAIFAKTTARGTQGHGDYRPERNRAYGEYSVQNENTEHATSGLVGRATEHETRIAWDNEKKAAYVYEVLRQPDTTHQFTGLAVYGKAAPDGLCEICEGF